MARKVVNRKQLRAEADAAEEATKTTKATKKKVAKKKTTRTRKAAKVVRLKAFWGVYNQSLKRVALFEHSERTAADKKAKDLSASSKSPHFVQPVKEVIEE